MTKGRYGGPQRRRSPWYEKRFQIALEYDGKTDIVRVSLAHYIKKPDEFLKEALKTVVF